MPPMMAPVVPLRAPRTPPASGPAPDAEARGSAGDAAAGGAAVGYAAAGEAAAAWPVRETATLETDAEAERRFNEFVVRRQIGQGAFGTVYEAAREVGEPPFETFALKKVFKGKLRRAYLGTRRGNGLDQLRREISICRRLRHRHVAALLEVIDDPGRDEILLVYELLEGPVLLWDAECGTFRDAAGAIPTLARSADLTGDLCRGLSFLRDRRVAHRDLKPQNLLLTAEGALRIADFGCAVADDEVDGPLTVFDTDGTMPFWSPEMCGDLRGGYDAFAADVWAAGVCLYALVYGALHVHAERPPEELLAEIRAFEMPPIATDAPRSGLLATLSAMLRRDAARRPTAAEVLESDFVRGIAGDDGVHAFGAVGAVGGAEEEEEGPLVL